MRNDDETPTSDPERFGRLLEGLRQHCPGMILQVSTGGRSGAGRERGGMLSLRPDMASLAAGSCNFPTRVYENSPDLVDWLAAEMLAHGVKPEIEAFDLAISSRRRRWRRTGRIAGPLHVQFVMGVKNAMPVDREVLEFYVATLRRLAPDCHLVRGRHRPGPDHAQRLVARWAAIARTGLEDNVRLDRDRLAPSNAALVRGWSSCARSMARRPATVAEARAMLGLAAAGHGLSPFDSAAPRPLCGDAEVAALLADAAQARAMVRVERRWRGSRARSA